MKKQLHHSMMFFLFAIATSIFTLGFTSCEELFESIENSGSEDEDENEGNNGSQNDFAYSTWADYDLGVKLSFKSDTGCSFDIVDKNNNVVDGLSGSYKRNGSKITFNFTDGYDDFEASAVINGNTMKFTAPDGELLTLTKQ